MSNKADKLKARLPRGLSDRTAGELRATEAMLATIRRVYERLAATDRGLARAKEIYATARPTYHPVSQAGVDRLLISGRVR